MSTRNSIAQAHQNAIISLDRMRLHFSIVVAVLILLVGCSTRPQAVRGIADKRTNFEKFVPMREDPGAEGLRAVEPFFRTANRAQILRAIETACRERREGSSVYNPSTRAGYYVNCNPENRQLLNGYIPSDPRRRPHSR
ncbi:MAG: hypothetical protein JO217_09475 [Acidobacteriaceae bacterium]|nr:hypothetical protein [Acidobacteriaceae bacterium]MBV9442913.1 hypothetical protein [Acidobacteriaceae bacterium]